MDELVSELSSPENVFAVQTCQTVLSLWALLPLSDRAATDFDIIIVLQVIRSKGLECYQHLQPNETLPDNILARVEELKTTLQCWLDVFEGFLISSELDIDRKSVV